MAETKIVQMPAAPSLARGHRIEFSPEQEKMVRDMFLGGAPPAVAQVLLELARVRGLNPITRQIHFVKRKNKKTGEETFTPQVAIDGFRAIAERTGRYAGQAGPFWCDKDGKWREVWLEAFPPAAARVGVYRPDFRDVLWGTATWASFAQLWPDGNPMDLWKKMPDVMLAKCAEAVALRRAFPEDLSGLYSEEEIPEEPIDINENRTAPPTPPVQSVPQLAPAAAQEKPAQPPPAESGISADEVELAVRTAPSKEKLLSLVAEVKKLTPADQDRMRKAYGVRLAEILSDAAARHLPRDPGEEG